MNWVVIGTFCISAVGLLAGLAAVYTRASLAAIQKEMAVISYRMNALDTQVAENKVYCHEMAHWASNSVSTFETRVKMLEYRMDEGGNKKKMRGED